MAASKVRVHHPKLPDGPRNPRTIDRASFEAVWKARGWRIIPATTEKKAGSARKGK